MAAFGESESEKTRYTIQRVNSDLLHELTQWRNEGIKESDRMLAYLQRLNQSLDAILNRLTKNGETLKLIQDHTSENARKGNQPFNPICAHCGQEIPQ